MKKNILNMEALVSVEIHDKERCICINWQDAKKGLFGSSKPFWGGEPEGFYYLNIFGGGKPIPQADLESGEWIKEHNNSNYQIKLLVIDKKVYYKPYIHLKYAGGVEKTIICDTIEEATQRGEMIAKKGMNAKIVSEGSSYNFEVPFQF